MEQKIETKKSVALTVILFLIVLIFLAGAWYWWSKRNVIMGPTEKVTPKEDSLTAINQELEEIKILGLEEKFQEIDQDLNSL